VKGDCAQLPTTGTNPRLTCYAQWEDYVPQRVRYGRGVRVDETISAQLRVDYRVSDNLKIFASANPNIRNFFSKDYNLDLAAPATGTTDTSGRRIGNILSATTSPTHYVTSYVQEVSLSTTALTAPTNYATSLTYPIQIRDLYRDQETNYYQAGADFDVAGWSGQARAQLSQAKTDRIDIVTGLNLPVQRLTFTQLPNSGAWNFEADTFTAGVSTYDPAAYYPQPTISGATAPAGNTAGRGFITNPAFNATTGLANNSISYFFDPRGAEDSEETNLQLDLTRDLEIFGPLKRIKVGIQKREFTNESWRPTFGEQVSPTVSIQSQAHTDQITACRPTTAATSCTPGAVTQINGTQVGGVLGTTSGALGNNFLAQRASLTEDQYKQLIDAIITPLPGAQFMAGVVDPELLQGWATINTDPIDPLLRQFGINLEYRDNQDCLYRCIATDGNFYDRPSVGTKEGTLSMYAMADFESRIFGMEVQENFGVRYQKIDVMGTSVTQVYNRVYQPVTNTATPPVTRVTNVDTLVTTKESTFTNESDDLMPSVNLTIWPIEDKVAVRFTRAKQRARPNLRQLAGAAGISCFNIDESQRGFIEAQLEADPTLLDDGNAQTDDASEIGNFFENTFRDRCTGRIGNPALSGYKATTSNISLEWYPNRDTNLSLTYFRINAQKGRPQNNNGVEDFLIDGNPYLVDSYLDGDGGLKTQGVEFNARTAFTFLPSILRHTGAGFNTSTTKSNGGFVRTDVLSGQSIEPSGQSSYYYNANLWYDDGRINARIAYQTRDHYFTGNGPTGNNRVPVPESASVGSGGFGGSIATSYFKTWQPIYRSTTKQLDARMSYTVNERLQLFIEGKNLLDDVVERYTPRELRDPGTPAELMQDIQYNGRRYYTGLILSF
jgi:TonB-dependent receptor